jgi:hypothetical protein
LYWLEQEVPSFFQQYALPLLQQYGIWKVRSLINKQTIRKVM